MKARQGKAQWGAILLSAAESLIQSTGGWWQADPGDNSVLIFLAHNMVELNQFAQGVGFGVFDAIIRFQSLASSRPR